MSFSFSKSIRLQFLVINVLAIILSISASVIARPHVGPGQQHAELAMVEAPSRFARFNEMRVHYKSYGAGDEALVFVHGWTCNICSWRFQPYAFKEKIRVILIDLPG